MSMTSLSPRARRLLPLAAALVASLAAVGCYNPTISEKFKCNTMYTPGFGDCPQGFHCSDGLCLKGPAPRDGGVDGSTGKPDAQPDVMMSVSDAAADAGPDVPAVCNMPVPGCAADAGAGKCDPVCQSGCAGCTEKCSATALGALTCNVPLPTRPKNLGEACNIASLNLDAQTDDCAPGLVCLNDSCGARCYKFCKADGDCPMSTCSRDAGGGVEVCDVQAVTCNPIINNNMPSGCPGTTQGCYLSPTVTDRTVCDCPFKAGGTNSSCSISRDCFPGLACVDVGGTGSSICRPVCSLAAGGTDCVGTTCTALNGSTKFGFCN